MMNETDLIKQAQAGKPDAFSELYARYHKSVYAYIYYRVGERPLAEDLTSDVFERMVKQIHTWRPVGKPFIAWLYTIAGNLVINHVRRQNLVEWQPLYDTEVYSGDSLMAQIGKKLEREKLAEALNQLTEEQRQVIILRFLQQQPVKTIAKTIGKSDASIKSLQRRAINALRRILESEGAHV